MPIIIKLPVEVKEIRPITVCFIAEVPYMVPTEVKIPNEVLKNLQAVLPGSRGFNWRLTGRQNLEFYALLYGLEKKEAEEERNCV